VVFSLNSIDKEKVLKQLGHPISQEVGIKSKKMLIIIIYVFELLSIHGKEENWRSHSMRLPFICVQG
jgi:hypothetical protein